MVSPEHSLSIRSQCSLLGLHRSGLYYCPKESFLDTQLMNRISELHHDFPYYGYRKIHWCLTQDGYVINHKKVHRLMKEMDIKAIYPGPKTSIPGDNGSVFPYLLKGLEIHKPNQVWSVDITYSAPRLSNCWGAYDWNAYSKKGGLQEKKICLALHCGRAWAQAAVTCYQLAGWRSP